MAFPRTRQGQWLVLALAVIVLGWLFIRVATGPAPGSDGPAPGALASQSTPVTGTAPPTQRHPGSPSSSRVPTSGLPWVAETALPREARHTLELIRAGGPYPYPRNDDKPFTNRERFLPTQPNGYYREYTVVTPGSGDRGPRRIIAGRAGDRYYTDDHYASFRQIREGT